MRNSRHDTIVLSSRDTPGGARAVSLFASDTGLLDAFVFGGPKSRLKSLASPYNEGVAWIYADPVRGFRKLSDFDVSDAHPGFRDSLQKMWVASIIAETVLATGAGGSDFADFFGIVKDALRSLDSVSGEKAAYAAIQFAWRWVAKLGLASAPSACAACGKDLRGISSFFDVNEGGFVCSDCSGSIGAQTCEIGESSGQYGDMRNWSGSRRSEKIEVSPGAVAYLSSTLSMSFDSALRAACDARSFDTLKKTAFAVLENACGRALKTIRSSSGIV